MNLRFLLSKFFSCIGTQATWLSWRVLGSHGSRPSIVENWRSHSNSTMAKLEQIARWPN